MDLRQPITLQLPTRIDIRLNWDVQLLQYKDIFHSNFLNGKYFKCSELVRSSPFMICSLLCWLHHFCQQLSASSMVVM